MKRQSHSALVTRGLWGRFRLKIPAGYEFLYVPKRASTASMGSKFVPISSEAFHLIYLL